MGLRGGDRRARRERGRRRRGRRPPGRVGRRATADAWALRGAALRLGGATSPRPSSAGGSTSPAAWSARRAVRSTRCGALRPGPERVDDPPPPAPADARRRGGAAIDGTILVSGGTTSDGNGDGRQVVGLRPAHRPLDAARAPPPPALQPLGRLARRQGSLRARRVQRRGARSPDVDVYDPRTNRWTGAAARSRRRGHAFGAVVVDGEIWVIGGLRRRPRPPRRPHLRPADEPLAPRSGACPAPWSCSARPPRRRARASTRSGSTPTRSTTPGRGAGTRRADAARAPARARGVRGRWVALRGRWLYDGAAGQPGRGAAGCPVSAVEGPQVSD